MSKNRFAKSAEQVENFITDEQITNDDIISSVKEQIKPKAKAYTFYLDDETVEKLRAVSKAQGVSASKMLNHILKNTL